MVGLTAVVEKSHGSADRVAFASGRNRRYCNAPRAAAAIASALAKRGLA